MAANVCHYSPYRCSMLRFDNIVLNEYYLLLLIIQFSSFQVAKGGALRGYS